MAAPTSNDEAEFKYARLQLKSVPLGRVLNKFREHYKALEQPDTLVVPYVLTCAAYLEAKLNDSLFHYSIMKQGEDMAEAMLSLSLPKKLNILVPALTDGNYSINKKYFVYQRLISLIRVRNSIAHLTSDFDEASIEEGRDMVTVPLIFSEPTKIPRKLAKPSDLDITLGASKTFTPLEYHEALEKLEKWFLHRCPDRLSKVAMVVAHPHGHWEENHLTMVKYLD